MSATPTTGPEFTEDRIKGSVFGGVIVPGFQYVLLVFLDGVPEDTLDGKTFGLFLMGLVTIGLRLHATVRLEPQPQTGLVITTR